MELTVGTPIKYKKRKFGIITGIGPERFGKTIEFVWHSGIKPRHSRGAPEDFQPISLERFKQYIKDSGHTSMRGYLLPIPQAVVSDAPAAVHTSARRKPLHSLNADPVSEEVSRRRTTE